MTRDQSPHSDVLSEAVRLHGAGRLDEAAAGYRRVLADDPRNTTALSNLGLIRKSAGEFEAALSLWRSALEAEPRAWRLHVSIGRAQVEMGEPEAAIESCGRALEANPRAVDALNVRANAFRILARLPAAMLDFDEALALEPDNALVLKNRGMLLSQLGRHEAAIADFTRSLALAPGQPMIAAARLTEQLAICDWSAFDPEDGQLPESLRRNIQADQPHNFLLYSASGADQLEVARRYARQRAPQTLPPLWRGERYGHDKLRIAYISSDFRSHPTAYLLAGLLEQHDRNRFEVYAVALPPRADDPWRRRILAAVDHFHDVAGFDDRQIAGLIREAEIDIAIDLNGYIMHCRPGVLAHRPAPIQINFLGYPGTIGSPHADYILADHQVVPPTHEAFYEEAVIRLPDSYFVNNHRARSPAPAPSRASCDLPDTAFVFCAFNAGKKLNPEIFGIWMRLLRRVEGSVFWLLKGPQTAQENLRREAALRGVDPERLIFADRAAVEEHLSRHQAADLFLDTFPCGAHTTGCDALWAGLPLVTCAGEPFASRVAASLLSAVGLLELVAPTTSAYEALAYELATNPPRLSGLRAKLARARDQAPLFDRARSCRSVERAYLMAQARHAAGLPPAPFDVPGDEGGPETV